MIWKVVGLVTALLCAGVGAVLWITQGLVVPARTAADVQTFSVGEGEPLIRVVRRLEQQGLLPDRALFGPRIVVLFAQFQGVDREIKAGEYDLVATMTPVEILEKLRTGEVKTYPVTIPEGLHLEETAERFEAAGIVEAVAFLAQARSAELARELEIEADDLEGYLFPETYRFRKDTPAVEVVRRMVEEFKASLTPEDRERIGATKMSLHEIVTLASIVEKETGAPEERPLIAAVFLNRLEKRMRLQTDPTVIYGILRTRGSFDGNLRRVDLRTDTPYNTYTRGGLPPGPIASVGMESIRAVLAPADVDYLYFVSRNDGTHYFSTTLRQHNNAVIRYQKNGRR